MRNVTPKLNLFVLRAPDIDRAAGFYHLLGISMEKHRHGKGPLHYCADLDGFILEIYPSPTTATSFEKPRLGLQISNLEKTLSLLSRHDVQVIKELHRSPWGFRAVVEDFAGHRVELVESAKESLDEDSISNFEKAIA